MTLSKLFFFSFSFSFSFSLFFLQPSINAAETCPDQVYCGFVNIDFPFRLRDQPSCCGNSNFNLSCTNNSKTIISFPYSGEFSVNYIGYGSSSLNIGDPENCIAKRLIKGLDLSGTPFVPLYPVSYTFLNCSYNVTVDDPVILLFSCLSGPLFLVLAIPTIDYDATSSNSSLRSCREITKTLVPLDEPDLPPYYLDQILLTWDEPECRLSCNNCESDHSKKKSGLSRRTKFALFFIVGIPIFFIFAILIMRHNNAREQPTTAEISNLGAEQQLNARTVNGLDVSSIEAYPITLLGDSFRLPRPDDNTCSICLSEYKAKETIRTIPDCGHYFHADCIEEWLKLNAACPICRNTPDQESALINHPTVSSSAPQPPH